MSTKDNPPLVVKTEVVVLKGVATSIADTELRVTYSGDAELSRVERITESGHVGERYMFIPYVGEFLLRPYLYGTTSVSASVLIEPHGDTATVLVNRASES